MMKYILSIALVLAATASTPLEKKANVPRSILSAVRAKDHLVSDETVTRWGDAAPRKLQSEFDVSSWTKLAADDVKVGDKFGTSVAVSHDFIVVGVPHYDGETDEGELMMNCGAVYLYSADGVFIKKILGFDGKAHDGFGFSVALTDDVIVVSAWGVDSSWSASGSVGLYDTNGNYIVGFFPDDIDQHDNFGGSVAYSNGIIVVGAIGVDSGKGAAYMYNIYGDLIKKLSYDGASTKFGSSVAISNHSIAVGAPILFGNGSVSLYDSNGNFVKTLVADDAPFSVDDYPNYDQFGQAVAVSNEVIVVGQTLNNNGNGAVHLYSSDGNFLKKLVGTDSDFCFGSSLAVSNDIIAVGSACERFEKGGPIYLYTTDGIFLKKLGPEADLGHAAFIDDLMVVGAPYSDIIAENGGAAYFSKLSIPTPQNLFVIGDATFSAPQVNDNTHSLTVSHIINGANEVEVQLYNKNCMNAINITDAVYISDTHYAESNFSYSINLNISLINNSSMNVEETDNGTLVEVCTEIITKLGNQPDGASSLEVSFKKMNYFFKFDLTNVTFGVKETTTLEAEEIQDNTQAVDMIVSACLCNESTFDCVAPAPAINQNERAFICLTPSSGVEISNFAITLQNGDFSYDPIKYGINQWEVVNDVLTDVEENESTLRISAALVKGLFEGSSTAINIFGNAFLKLASGKSIGKRMTFSPFELQVEIVGEEEEGGELDGLQSGFWFISNILAFFGC